MPCECQKRQATSQEGRAIDPLRHSKGVVREKPSGKTGNSTENTGSDASRHHRQPRSPSPWGDHWGAQECRGRQALG